MTSSHSSEMRKLFALINAQKNETGHEEKLVEVMRMVRGAYIDAAKRIYYEMMHGGWEEAYLAIVKWYGKILKKAEKQHLVETRPFACFAAAAICSALLGLDNPKYDDVDEEVLVTVLQILKRECFLSA